LNDFSNKIPKKITILIVEDEKLILETFIEIFRLKGYNCDGAYNGLEALKLLEENNYDVIISDINMPIMNGPTFFKKFREKDKDTPFVFITGYEVTKEIKEVIKKANAIFTKPVSYQEFFKTIESFRSPLINQY
jgi:CheY-like chemotaxis protein